MIETNLILGIPGLPPESARNCVQELTPIPNGEFKKSINGNLMFLETTQRRRYRSVISCHDINSAICDEIWIGTQISVGCIQNLWQTIEIGKTEINLIKIRKTIQQLLLPKNFHKKAENMCKSLIVIFCIAAVGLFGQNLIKEYLFAFVRG